MDEVEKVEALCKEIGGLLYGQGPDIQSAVLAELLSMWVAGHRPELRARFLKMHLDLVQQLIPINAAMIRGGLDS